MRLLSNLKVKSLLNYLLTYGVIHRTSHQSSPPLNVHALQVNLIRKFQIVYISVAGGRRPLTAFKILFELLIYTSLCRASYFSSSVKLHFYLLLFHHIMSHCFTTFSKHQSLSLPFLSLPFWLSAKLLNAF